MSDKPEVSRREFLKATTQAGAALATLNGMGFAEHLQPAEGSQLHSQSSTDTTRNPKGNWPQEYTVRRDEAAGELILSTPYYAVVHDLKHGGAITTISYTHGQASNLLVNPLATSIRLAATKPPSPEELSDLHDSSPEVSVSKRGKWEVVNAEATLRTANGQDAGVHTKTTYEYRWGYIKIHKEFVFPEQPLRTAILTVLSATLHPSLTHFGRRSPAFDNNRPNPFDGDPFQPGIVRPGSYLNPPFSTRYIPCHVLLANPGVEGIEWFVSDDLGQWYYQMTGEPGTGHVQLKPSSDPLGIDFTVSPLELPSDAGLARGGFVSLSGSYAFDYYIGMTILEGHAHRRWLEVSFTPNGGRWVSDEEIRRNAEAGIVTMTLHNDGDDKGDGLFWRDGSYPPYPPDQMNKMEHVIETCHQNGIKVMPYFSNHEFRQSNEAFKLHGEEWARKPDDQGNLSPDTFYGAQMCFKSGWKDFFKSYVDTVLKHHPWDGIYYDWNLAMYCNNPLHMGKTSNGVSGAKGLASYAFSATCHWDVDEFLEMVEWTRERVGPEGLVTLHTSSNPMLATENFADFVCTLEDGGGGLVMMPKPDELPLEWNLAGARARADIEYGIIDTKAPQRLHRLFYLTTLLTGTAPWPANYESAELFKILRPLGDPERYHFEDWRNRAVKLDQNDLLSAVYSRAGEAYVLLANLQPEPRKVNCVINPQALKHPLTSVRSAKLVEQGSNDNLDAGRLTGEGETILLPGDGVRLLHLQT